MAVENPVVPFDTVVSDDKTVAKPRTRTRKFLRFLWRSSVFVMALLFVVHFAWRFSGSNQWELASDVKGAKVYTLKQPGSDMRQVKGVIKVRSSMAGIAAWMQDTNACKKIGCLEASVERLNDQLEYDHFQFKMVRPFKPRDFILRAHFHQIPTTKELWVEYAAAPERAPQKECCVRVTKMNNTWRFTPLGNGEVEAEYTMNMDWGGFIPNALQNLAQPKYMSIQLRKMQYFLDDYQGAKVAFIQEPTPATTVVALNASTPTPAPVPAAIVK